MKLDKTNFDQIVNRYLAGKATKREIDFLHAYYNAFEQASDFTNQLSGSERKTLEDKINSSITKDLGTIEPVIKTNFTFFKYAAALLVAAMLSVSYFIFTHTHKDQSDRRGLANNNSLNAGQIVLKLANGKEVKLENDGLSKTITESGTTFYSEKPGELNYITSLLQPLDTAAYNEVKIPYGKQFKITLADGTRVWLNAASSLKFPVAFQSKEREVYVSGEAYFQVRKDVSRPFIVHTKQSRITVTGTEFNVASYPDRSEVKTTLIEGCINITFANQTLKLVPGEESISNLDNQPIIKAEANIENTIAWRSGYFVFDQPLKEVMNILSRWYGTKIILDRELENSTVAGKFSNKRSIEQILTYIGQLKGFTIDVNGKIIELKKLN
ncbi:FecR family protein [Pedobacter sp. MR22-3]|uniref:FecR family protein n=1 Tax=Pedobacter sp. MR22-3 TaxID=2994552 RepID=UPI002245B630|nr:FecR domain-containing protein [Pedobacter sp. MR22-3]MCX2585261.1 FecR domain-containing protein [Pedobacter sp. MR22-3]